MALLIEYSSLSTFDMFFNALSPENLHPINYTIIIISSYAIKH